jgi:hypothetical protein
MVSTALNAIRFEINGIDHKEVQARPEEIMATHCTRRKIKEDKISFIRSRQTSEAIGISNLNMTKIIESTCYFFSLRIFLKSEIYSWKKETVHYEI